MVPGGRLGLLDMVLVRRIVGKAMAKALLHGAVGRFIPMFVVLNESPLAQIDLLVFILDMLL